jgi:hypothetical protein
MRHGTAVAGFASDDYATERLGSAGNQIRRANHKTGPI